MRNNILISASLLFNFCCVSVSKYQTVEVQSGETATLLCSNFSTVPSLITWFKLVNRSQPVCVGHMFESLKPASFCSGKGKFEITSNISTIFLNITEVDSSDSGLYFCGYSFNRSPVIVDATFVDVQEASDGMTILPCIILVGLVVVLLIIIVFLAVQVKKLKKAHTEEQNPIQDKNHGSDDLNYAAVTFRPKTQQNHESALEREAEPNPIYSATRQRMDADDL